MKIASGKIIFSCSWAAFSSARWRRRTRICSACTVSTLVTLTPSCSACRIGADEVVQVGHLRAQHHVLQRVAARAADAHLGQHARELGRQRVVALFDQALNRGVEAEARLDADDQQVERIGQRALNLLLARLRLAAQQQSGPNQPNATPMPPKTKA